MNQAALKCKPSLDVVTEDSLSGSRDGWNTVSLAKMCDKVEETNRQSVQIVLVPSFSVISFNLYANTFKYRAGSAYLKLTKNMPDALSINQFKRLASRALFRYDVS